MHTFDSDKQRILDRVSLVDVVSQHVTLRRVGRRLVGLCPFHSEKTPSFYVNPDLGLFKCFGCGKGGDIFTFVQARENVAFPEALQMLADRAGVELRRSAPRAPGEITRSDLFRVNEWAGQFFARALAQPPGEPARNYLRERNTDPTFSRRFGLGLAVGGDGSLRQSAERAGISFALLKEADLLREDESRRPYDTFRNRLMFPIRDASGRTIGFGGRTLGDDRAKYLNTRQTALFDKGRMLYGLDLAREAITERRRAIVVEGYFDCLAAHQGGFPETVATLGTALTEFHADLLRRYTEEAVILFDSDSAGEAAAERAIAVALPRCLRVRLARIPEGKDPSDFFQSGSPEAFSDILNRAVDALEFKWLVTLARFHGDRSDAARREAMRDFLRVVASACNGGAMDVIQRGLMVNQVAHVLHMDRSEVHRLLAASGRSGSSGTKPQGLTAPSRPHDPVQAAWESLLEAALADPAAADVGNWPDSSGIADAQVRALVEACRELSDGGGVFSLADLMACLPDGELGRRAGEMAERGLARGHIVATRTAALSRLHSARRVRELEESKLRLHQGSGTIDDRTELATIHDRLRERRGFAPRRFVASLPVREEPEGPSKPTSTMES